MKSPTAAPTWDSLFGGSRSNSNTVIAKNDRSDAELDKIHVFSLATGHMYVNYAGVMAGVRVRVRAISLVVLLPYSTSSSALESPDLLLP